MKKHLILLILLGCVISAGAQKPKPVPVINYKSALENRITVKLSEVATDIEYVSLKSPIELNSEYDSYMSLNEVIVGNKLIVLKSGYYQKIFVFDRLGNFVTVFGKIGAAENEFANINLLFSSSWDLSPDERHLIVTDRASIKLFSTDGTFIRSCSLPDKNNSFYFLDNDHIVVHRKRWAMKQDGYQILIYNSNLKLTDSLFWTKSLGVKMPTKPWYVDDDFYKMQGKIYFRQAEQDTLFQILPDSKPKATYVFDFDQLNPPGKWMSREEKENYRQVSMLRESENFFILYIRGAYERDGYLFETICANKTTGEIFSVDSLGIYNDLDGLNPHGFLPSAYDNEVSRANDKEVDFNEWNSLNEYLQTDTIPKRNLKNNDQITELRNVIESSEEGNPIIRIVNYEKPKKHFRKINRQPNATSLTELTQLKPVRTNHQWVNADLMSDQTYDSSDDSFWLSKQELKSIEHRSRTGEKLPGGFKYDKKKAIEGITWSKDDDTFWLADLPTDSIFHYDKTGKNLGDGFHVAVSPAKAGGKTGILGIAYDPTDKTLWLIETDAQKIWHYTTSGRKLGEYIDILRVGCNNGRGLAYDPRDNSLWIVNAWPNKMIHINKNGDELPGSFYFDNMLALPDGVALDYKGYEFWISDWYSEKRNPGR